jgi:integrase/recombinase XerD
MNTVRNALDEYLAMRRALGYQLRDAGLALPAFVSFLEQRGESHITTELALEWSQLPSRAKPSEWAKRLSFVRGFARYRSATDPCTEVPPQGLLPHPAGRAQPYPYTDEEIQRLMNAALRLPPTDGLRPWNYYGILGLLTVTGLRISEVLSLQRPDVDLQEGLLTIRHSKFDKSRLVPLHASTQQVLADYAQRRDRVLGKQSLPYFWVSDRGRPLAGSTVRQTFYELSRKTGLRGPSDHHGPRLHDLRHRFAVQTLVSWYRSGEDVDRRLPILSTYLGHACVSDTYWYLSFCPELMGLATARLERRWEGRS